MLHFQLKSYLSYLFHYKHRGGHGIHSPFVYKLLTDVIEQDKNYYAFHEIERLRNQLLHSYMRIVVSDFGTGSKKLKGNERRVCDITRFSSQKPKYCRLLFRLVNEFQPGVIIELGTSLGFATQYLASAAKSADVYTIEGCPEISRLAAHNFSLLERKNITLINGNFDTELPLLLSKLKSVDFVYFDGNHSCDATLRYFNHVLPSCNENTVLVFDDIYWSEEMAAAWNEIKGNERVKVTIDLFKIGIAFFRNSLSKQDFKIRF